MNFRLSSIIATLGCVLLASCYPYDESKHKQPTQPTKQKTVTTPEQQKIQEQRDQLKAAEEAKKKEEELKNPVAENPGTTNPTTDAPKPPTEEKRTDYAVANKVPGKEGYVFSPYNNKLVDVRDIPSGTLVQDPTYTGAGKGYFRVP
ncbi:MAG TPA: hypothetical protein VF258_01795 [Luteolibacter sp.]